MAIAIDASSPPIKTTATTGSLTTASFTPPSGALLVAVGGCGQTSGDPPAHSLTDSLGGTWTTRADGRNGGGVSNRTTFVATRVIGSSAAMTVSLSWTGLDQGSQLTVWVVTGQDSVNPIGATLEKGFSSATTAFTGSLTTTVSGSRVFGGACSFGSHTMSAASNTSFPSMSGTNPLSGSQGSMASFLGTSNTGSPGATTFGVTLNSSDFGDMALVEIKPSSADSGTITSTLPHPVTAAISGTVILPNGPISSTLPHPVTAAFTGTAAPPSGSLGAQLPKVTTSITTTSFGGPLSVGLPKLTQDFEVGVEPLGSLSASLPKLRPALAGETRLFGSNVILVDDEKRAFRVTQDDLVDIYRSQVAFLFSGPNGNLKTTLPKVGSIFLGPLGDTGDLGISLKGVTASFSSAQQATGDLNSSLRGVRSDFEVQNDTTPAGIITGTLPSLGSTDFEAYNGVSWVNSGAFTHGTGDITPPLPTGWAQGDTFILVANCAEEGFIGAPAGWNPLASSPQQTGSSTTGSSLAVFWRVATASESNPTVTDSGDHTSAVIHAFRGCDAVNGPIDTEGGIFQTEDDVTVTTPSISTGIPNEMVVYIGSHGIDSASAQVSLATNDADLENVTERTDASTTDGVGGGLFVYTATSDTATFVDSATFTLATASARAAITVALMPQVSD